jgi:hypothetical protein
MPVKLTEDQVRNIRDLYFNNSQKTEKGEKLYSRLKLARQFNVSKANIRAILSMKTWTNIETVQNETKYKEITMQERRKYLEQEAIYDARYNAKVDRINAVLNN